MHYNRIFLVCLVVCLLVAACGGVGGPKTVKVVAALPLGLVVGEDMLNAVKLALDEAGGKAGDVTVELLVFDNSDPDGSPISTAFEETAARTAIDDPAVVAYLGPLTSSQAKVSMPLLNEASIAQIAASTTWPGLTKPGYGPGEPGTYYPTGRRHFFRTVPSDEVQGAAAARWVQELGFQTVYIVNETSAYGSGVAGIFKITAQDIGLGVIGHDTYDADTVTPGELDTLAAKVLEADPDLVYIGGGAASMGDELVRALRQLDQSTQIMGPDGLVLDDLIEEVGAELSEGVYGTNVAIPASRLESPAAADFLASYKAAYGKEPSPYVVATYEAMKVLLHAIERAEEPTREGVLSSMQNLGDYSGVFGTWHFDERGDTSITAIGGMRVQDGAWVFVQVVK